VAGARGRRHHHRGRGGVRLFLGERAPEPQRFVPGPRHNRFAVRGHSKI
jgi:hypothetical protein